MVAMETTNNSIFSINFAFPLPKIKKKLLKQMSWILGIC